MQVARIFLTVVFFFGLATLALLILKNAFRLKYGFPKPREINRKKLAEAEAEAHESIPGQVLSLSLVSDVATTVAAYTPVASLRIVLGISLNFIADLVIFLVLLPILLALKLFLFLPFLLICKFRSR